MYQEPEQSQCVVAAHCAVRITVCIHFCSSIQFNYPSCRLIQQHCVHNIHLAVQVNIAVQHSACSEEVVVSDAVTDVVSEEVSAEETVSVADAVVSEAVVTVVSLLVSDAVVSVLSAEDSLVSDAEVVVVSVVSLVVTVVSVVTTGVLSL